LHYNSSSIHLCNWLQCKDDIKDIYHSNFGRQTFHFHQIFQRRLLLYITANQSYSHQQSHDITILGSVAYGTGDVNLTDQHLHDAHLGTGNIHQADHIWPGRQLSSRTVEGGLLLLRWCQWETVHATKHQSIHQIKHVDIVHSSSCWKSDSLAAVTRKQRQMLRLSI